MTLTLAETSRPDLQITHFYPREMRPGTGSFCHVSQLTLLIQTDAFSQNSYKDRIKFMAFYDGLLCNLVT